MNIVVNGEKFNFDKELTIDELLNFLKIKDKVMAVAVDMEIVKKENWEKQLLKDGNRVELLHFVGGG